MLATWFTCDSPAAKRVAWGLALLSGAMSCASVVCIALLARSSVDDIAGVEPYVVYTLSELQNNAPLYKDPQSAPFSVTQYAPLYYLLVHALSVPCNSTTVLELTTLGRFVSTGFLAAQLALLAWLLGVWQRTGWRVVAVVLLAVVVTTAPWQVCARPDSMLSFVGLLSLACVLRSTNARRGRLLWLLLAMAIASVSLFVKQSGVINVAAVVVATALGRRWREVVVVGLAGAACIAAGVVGCVAIWGSAFFANVVTGVRNGVQLDPALLDTFTTLSGLYLPLLFGGVYVASIALWQASAGAQARVIAAFVLVTVLAASVLALKRGSAINYFNDYFVFALMLLAVAGNTRVPDLSQAFRSALLVGGTLWLATLFVRNLAVPVGYAWAARGGEHDYAVLSPLAATLRSELEADDSYAATRHSGLAAALAPRAILPMPAITDQLYRDGILDAAGLEAWLKAHHVSRAVAPSQGNTLWYGPVSLGRTWCETRKMGSFDVHTTCQRE
jgi:hypothetical protein